MARRKKNFRYQSLQDSKSIQDILKAVASGIEKGRLTFSDEDEKIVMKPDGLLDLKVTAIQDAGRDRFTIRVSWQVDEGRTGKKKSLSVK